jgi:putative ABC transport system substrate-binding protein
MLGIRRREFIALIGAATAWPLAARAQQELPVVGFLHSGLAASNSPQAAAFRQGLAETGFVEARNLKIEYRFAELQNDRLPALVADLISRRVAVIAGVNSTEAVRIAMAATSTIPIVFSIGGDPVKMGLVASFNRPGGNVTGTTGLSNEMTPKRLELLRDLIPDLSLVAALVNPDNPNAKSDAEDLLAAAPPLGLKVEVLEARNERDIDAFFRELVQRKASAFISASDPLFSNRRQQIIALATYHRIPAVLTSRDDVVAGALMSYGDDLANRWQQAGVYTGRILKGEKPADLPIMQPTKFALVINLKTAKAIGLKVSEAVLLRANEIIE